MTKNNAFRALTMLVALLGIQALSAATDRPDYTFQKLGNDRILLMNNDNNEYCPVTLQGYGNTDKTQSNYWEHAGLDEPAGTRDNDSVLYNMVLADGDHHTMWKRDLTVDLAGKSIVNTNKLWELVCCRVGSCLVKEASSSNLRNWIPWTTKSIAFDGTSTLTSIDYKKVGMISMQNTTDACIYSPLYEDGIGTVYFDAVNGWIPYSGRLALEVATNTVDGSKLTRDTPNAVWQKAKFDVLCVAGASRSKVVFAKEKNVEEVKLASSVRSAATAVPTATGGWGGTFFYRIRANLNYRGPIRFRIQRLDTIGDWPLDSEGYMIVDNILVSPPPPEAEFTMYGKGYDESREKTRILGWEGAFTFPFLFVGKENITPWMRYGGKKSAYIDAPPIAWTLSDVKFHYRWTYLGLDSKPWQTIDMVKDGINYFAENDAKLDLTEGVGDIEFYYTATMNSAPHYDPVDYACGTVITNKCVIGGKTYKMPYGTDWMEGNSPVPLVCRRDPKEGPLPSGGTDWFARVRDGNTQYEDVAVILTEQIDDERSVVTNAYMELVGERSWRLYYYTPTNAVGKKLKFHFVGYNNQSHLKYEQLEMNTNHWYISSEKVGYLPFSGAADGKYDAEITLDAATTHLLFEFDEATKSFAVSHAAYQDFNLWTDSAKGYMGYYSTTAAVSEAKKTFPEDFDSWESSATASSIWNESFDVFGIIETNSPYYPNVEFVSQRTPNGWSAANGLYRCQSFTNTENGLSLQLQGCGRGSVALENLPASDIPAGIGNVDFTARIAQPNAFESFAYSMVGYRETNYMFTVKTEMSVMRGVDMSDTDPTLSLVGYYRPGRGCYEARLRRISDMSTEFTLWKWEPRGTTVQPRQLTRRTIGRPGCNLDSTEVFFNRSSDHYYSNWHTMSLSMFNTATGTVVQAKIAKSPSSYDYSKDWPSALGGSNNNQVYLILTVCDNVNPLTQGTYGVGTANCTGYFGYPAIHTNLPVRVSGTTYVNNPTNFSFTGRLLSDEFPKAKANPQVEESLWALPAGRYRLLSTDNPSYAGTQNEATKWQYGVVAVVPQQEVIVQTMRADSSYAEWVEAGRVAITNFQAVPYSILPMASDNSYVKLTTGGSSLDTRTDVMVDDISINAWRGGDYPNIGGNYGQKDNWVYTGCWIESAVGLDGAYDVVPVPGTNEYCYIFTNAGRTVTFTPREDMYLSQALVVGGGGAGGWGCGGGGGGGGVHALTNGVWLRAGVPVMITVGAGGNNYFSEQSDTAHIMRGDCGGLSRLTIGDGEGGFDDYTAYGGGGGGSYYGGGYGNNNYAAERLATGGGYSGNGNSSPTAGSTATGLPGEYGRGGGGNAGNCVLYGGGGGGGGAGGNGGNGTTNNFAVMNSNHNLIDLIAGEGGIGYPSDITGKTVYYGGGGGGADAFLYCNKNATEGQYKVDGHQYYGYYGTGSTWGSKYWLVRGSDVGNVDYGNRTLGKGGLGGGGAGAPCCQEATGEDGANGFGGGGGGGGAGYYTKYRPGGRGGDGAVILRLANYARHQCVIMPTRGSSASPVGVRSPWLQNGMAMINFSYAGAHSNAVVLLQVCTNMTSYSELYNKTYSLNDGWTTLETYTFEGDEPRSGTKACYVNLRAPVKGAMRLIASPDVVSAAAEQDDPNYGSIAITKIICYDEPMLDARSWTGWNMWTTGWDGEKPNEFAYLYDGLYGYSCSLNWSAVKNDNLSGITGYDSDLAEPDKVEGDNEYAQSYPYVQCPAMNDGVGYVKFRAKMMSPDQGAPSVVTLFGLTEPDDPSTAEELTNIVVDARRWKQYTWKTTAEHSDYRAIRLAVKGAQGTGGRNNPFPEYYMDGKKIEKLQRVMIDEVGMSEPIAPRLALINARPFRDGLMASTTVSNILDEAQQPLTRESFGFQVQLQPQQMADDVDYNSIRVFVAYYVGTSPWGWRNWTNEPSAVTAELTRTTSGELIWRSTYDNSASVVSGQAKPGTVLQYHFWTTYNDNAGKPHCHELDAIDWDGGPSWYWPVDYNKQNGGNDPSRFSAYTILDSVSPRRAWINEVEYHDVYGYSSTNQFIEVAVPSGVDMSGWYLRVAERNYREPNVLAIFGLAGGDGQTIATSTARNPTNHYSFLTLISPKTKGNGGVGVTSDGVWNKSVKVGSGVKVIDDGVLYESECYALELVRPSGVVEHQIVVQGTNLNARHPSIAYLSTGEYLTGLMQESDRPGNTWFFAGIDEDGGTLGVYTNHGEDASCWTNRMAATPTRVNRGQVIDPDWYIPPSSDFVWIYANILGEHMNVVDGENVGPNATFMVPRHSNTNVLFKLDPWYEVAAVTTNGGEVVEAPGQRGTYVLSLKDVTNTVDVMASARLSSDITDRLDPNDPYYGAVCDWLLAKDEEPIVPARFIGLYGKVTNNLSLKQMYWLDIPPTEEGWVFRAGMAGGPVDTNKPISQPCVPVPYTDASGNTMTNVRVTVFLQLSNELQNVAYPPDHLLGLNGESSADYTGRPNWTGVTFKVRGALQNGIANDVKLPLRWFVFGPESFGAPGTPEAFTATIEITDPFTKGSPADHERWSDYIGCPVFYSWMIDETRSNYSTEMLKKQMINE